MSTSWALARGYPAQRAGPRTPLELLRAYRAGQASYGQQQQCPYPTDDTLAAMWERGREEVRLRAEAGGRMRLQPGLPGLETA